MSEIQHTGDQSPFDAIKRVTPEGREIAKGAMYNTPYQQYMQHFEVIPHEFERSNGEIGCSYTTYVQPSGIDFIRKRLGLPTIDPLPIGGMV